MLNCKERQRICERTYEKSLKYSLSWSFPLCKKLNIMHHQHGEWMNYFWFLPTNLLIISSHKEKKLLSSHGKKKNHLHHTSYYHFIKELYRVNISSSIILQSTPKKYILNYGKLFCKDYGTSFQRKPNS